MTMKRMDNNLGIFHFINHPVFKIDPAGPIASIIGFQRFGLSNPVKRETYSNFLKDHVSFSRFLNRFLSTILNPARLWA